MSGDQNRTLVTAMVPRLRSYRRGGMVHAADRMMPHDGTTRSNDGCRSRDRFFFYGKGATE
ncbi:MAG: hypothetical protein KDB37_21770, partial [Ilumatobacter sp.]|nr:hypothetical protein [Ilumatobacter sp.]